MQSTRAGILQRTATVGTPTAKPRVGRATGRVQYSEYEQRRRVSLDSDFVAELNKETKESPDSARIYGYPSEIDGDAESGDLR